VNTGRIIAGGTLMTLSSAVLPGQALFEPALGSAYQILSTPTGANASGNQTPLDVVQSGRGMVLAPGSMLNLSGASDTYDQLSMVSGNSLRSQGYIATPVWSDAGTLSAGPGMTLTGAIILAQGGSSQANGGTLVAIDPILAQHDSAAPTANVISAD